MTEMITAEGTIGVLNEKHELMTETQPCTFSWAVGTGRWAVELHTTHEFEIEEDGACAVAIFDPRHILIWASPIMAYPIGFGRLRV